jgi:hypothetical protein
MSIAAAAPPKTAPACQRHHDRPAQWKCDSCQRLHCDECLKAEVPGRIQKDSCPECRGYCRSLRSKVAKDAPRSFPAMVQDAFAYPLRGHGSVILILGGLFLALIDILSRSWRMRSGIFFAVFGAGYLAAYMFHIVEASAMGKRKLPEWPEFSNFWDSICIPFFQMALPTIACCLPACVPIILFGWNEQAFAMAVAIAIVCSFYLPMAILAIAVNNSVAGMHLGIVFPAIWAVFLRYAAIWLTISAVGAVSQIVYHLVLEEVPLLGLAMNMWVSLYLIAAEMRLIGILYYTSEGKLKLV